MKSFTSTIAKRLLFFAIVLVSFEFSFGQTIIDAIGTTYTQNFDGLYVDGYNSDIQWTDNTSLVGWYARTDNTPTIIAYSESDGWGANAISAGLYTFGIEGTNLVIDRSLGWVPSVDFTGTESTGKGYIGWRFKNNTGKSIGTIQIKYTGEQWYKISAGVQNLVLRYQVGNSVTSLTAGIFTVANTETINSQFDSPIFGADATDFVLDGNDLTNRTADITVELNVTIPIGEEIMLRWEDVMDPANHIMSIDDVSFKALKESQTISFNTLPDKNYSANGTFELIATATSGDPVTFASSNPSILSISGTTATIHSSGQVVITASQAGNATFSPAINVTQVQVIVPAAPVATAATSVGVAGFTANWNASAGGADEYWYYYSTDYAFTSPTVGSVGSSLTAPISGLYFLTTYYYRIRSKSGTVYSDYSNIITVTTGDPIQTYNIVATTPSNNNAGFTSQRLTWSNGNLAGRILFMKDGSGSCPNPVDLTNYTASSNWNSSLGVPAGSPSGSQLSSSGFYCIYKGTGTTVTLTNLYPGRTYTVQAFEFASGNTTSKFLTAVSGANNPKSYSKWGTTTWTNSSGVTSPEAWNATARWDHATVPTAALHPAVKVYIDGNCEVSTDAVANNLTIKASHDAISPKLTINTASSLMVTDTLKNLNGANALLIKSGSSAANGSLIFHNAYESPVQATVEMYSKAFYDSNGPTGYKYKWQFFGIPVRTALVNPTFNGSNIRKFNETGWYAGSLATNHWINLLSGNVSPFAGYEVTSVSPKTYYFSGELVTGDYNSGVLGYTAEAQYPGQHLIGNPYTAAINISDIEFGTTDANIIENSVYLYNTGSYADWTSAGSGAASINESSTPGQYIVIPKNVAGRGTGIPAQIPSMQAFLVKVKINNDPLGWVKITYPAIGAATSLGKNTTLQRAPSADLPCTRIDVKGASFGDMMWIFTEPTCTRGFDNGWDGYKEERIGTAVPKLFAMETSGNYQVNTVDNIHNSVLGFMAGTGSDYTFTFTHQNIESTYSKLYLYDIYTGNYTDITQSGSQYSFTSSNSSASESRFKIVTSIDNTTETANVVSAGLRLSNSQNTIFIHNSTAESGTLELFDLAGRKVQIFTFNANETTTLSTSISAGSYIAKAQTKSKKTTLPIIIK